MNKTYLVPALEKAHHILMLIADSKEKRLKLTDLVLKLNYNKSTVFSLLSSMEQFKWIVKNEDLTYSIGSTLGRWGVEFFRNFNIREIFDQEAKPLANEINQTIQLSILDGQDIIYLSKQNGNQSFKITTYPGLRVKAYAPAMGKVLLSRFSYQELSELYEEKFEPLTIATVRNVHDLWQQIEDYHTKGYIIEREETILGFVCLAVPIFNDRRKIIAAMSTTLTTTEADKTLDLELICEKMKAVSKKISASCFTNFDFRED
ncbi:MAG: IclR family transcriptional regulator [Sporomusaceae bacterium]|jgi:IclR family KDG regulon transcriptional repressor|nr:IclR family transcriptional regulator [Sporomusaceae bacterium]